MKINVGIGQVQKKTAGMFWSFLGSLVIVGSGISAPAADQYACQVAGHGPYNETIETCRRMAFEQARTTCALKSATSRADFFHRDLKSDKRAKGSCQSTYDPTASLCSESVCHP